MGALAPFFDGGYMEEITVIKRDGTKVLFDKTRIFDAISKASQASKANTNKSTCQCYTDLVLGQLPHQTELTVEDIQKVVENVLMDNNKQIARAYIEYRHDRDKARERKSQLVQDIEGLIDQTDLDILNENANKDSRIIPTMRDLLAGIVSKYYAKKYMLPLDIVQAHERGEIHFHDMDYSPLFPITNCCLVDLKGMLNNGFKMGNAEIETPKSISTATAITAQIIAQVASHQYGGTTINRIDEVLAPYVRLSYDKHYKKALKWCITEPRKYALKMTKEECFDAFQALEYEINTLHTSNGQTPFTTLGFGLGTSWESRLIQKAILKNRINGLGKSKKTAIFPKLVFTIRKGVNFDKSDPNYDVKQLALKCSALRMYPDILNYDQVVKVTGSFKAPMGCRSFLAPYKDDEGNLIHDGRNNLGVVSVNLPRIALEAKGDETKFWNILDTRLDLCKKALMCRIARFEGVPAKVAPILYMEGAFGVRLKPDDPISEIFKNGRASISLGYIGIHEAVNALYGAEYHIIDNVEKQELSIKIIQKLRETCDLWKAETGYGFSLYGTPAENLCNRFCKLDANEFGLIKGVTDKGYYTNSFHLDVEKKVDPYTKLYFEMPYPQYSNGGFICYGEFPNMKNNLKALEDIWDYSYDKVPYYGTNTPVDECYECGYKGEFKCTSKGFECPNCGNTDSAKASVIRRVCGYLGSPNTRPFNTGKQEEVHRRVKHLD